MPPANPAFTFFFAPYPPDPLPAGKGEIFSFLMQGASPLASPGLNLRFAAKPIEQPFYWQCRQPRRGGTGGEELRRLRWSSPPGQVEQMPHGERSPAPVGRHRSRGRTTHPAGELSPCLACATCRSHPWRGRGREVRQRRGWQAAKRENSPP